MIRSLQCSDTVLMIRPANFGFNAETAENNAFQSDVSDLQPSKIAELAVTEFDGFAKMLEDNNVEVVVVEDTPKPLKTDAVFPNNWVSSFTGTVRS